jgi:hypothetical protein
VVRRAQEQARVDDRDGLASDDRRSSHERGHLGAAAHSAAHRLRDVLDPNRAQATPGTNDEQIPAHRWAVLGWMWASCTYFPSHRDTRSEAPRGLYPTRSPGSTGKGTSSMMGSGSRRGEPPHGRLTLGGKFRLRGARAALPVAGFRIPISDLE